MSLLLKLKKSPNGLTIKVKSDNIQTIIIKGLRKLDKETTKRYFNDRTVNKSLFTGYNKPNLSLFNDPNTLKGMTRKLNNVFTDDEIEQYVQAVKSVLEEWRDL